MPNKPEPPMNSKLPKPNTTNSELTDIREELKKYNWSSDKDYQIAVIASEALIASKVEEAERSGILWVRNHLKTAKRDTTGAFHLVDDVFIAEVDAYLASLQSREQEKL